MQRLTRAKVEIDLSALKNNVRQIQRQLNSPTEIMGIVKADAYGHGAVAVAHALIEEGIKFFGVAIIEEAIELRKSGIKERILILGACFPNQISKLMQYDFEQSVYSYSLAKEIQKEAAAKNKIAKIHIKIDTGMGRIGFAPSQSSIEEISQIFQMPNIKVEGIFTHFASSAAQDKTYTNLQHERFLEFISSLKNRNITIPSLHVANSGAIFNAPKYNYDYVRVGLLLYGAYPSKFVDRELIHLEPVMRFKSVVTFVKTVQAGVCISYDSRFVAQRETVVATIPVGYADGVRKQLECGRGRVIINGQFAPIIGSICMDQFMVDITDCGKVEVGEEVVLIGSQGERAITAEDVADVCGTIPHDIFCNFGKRAKKRALDYYAILR